MRFRPCIDLHKGKVKQIVGSSFSDADESAIVTNFESSQPPAHFARLYKKDNLFGGHVIMLGPGNEQAALEVLSAFPGGLHIGGGITPENARVYLDAGASHVIITSCVFKNGIISWENLEKLVASIGKKRLVLDLSCVKQNNSYVIVTDRWQKVTNVSISDELLGRLARFCDEFLVHAADVEGKQQGVDIPLINLLAQHSLLPVTYAGGVRSFDDLDIVFREGNGVVDVTIGSALDIFGGTLKYRDVVKWFEERAIK